MLSERIAKRFEGFWRGSIHNLANNVCNIYLNLSIVHSKNKEYRLEGCLLVENIIVEFEDLNKQKRQQECCLIADVSLDKSGANGALQGSIFNLFNVGFGRNTGYIQRYVEADEFSASFSKQVLRKLISGHNQIDIFPRANRNSFELYCNNMAFFYLPIQNTENIEIPNPDPCMEPMVAFIDLNKKIELTNQGNRNRASIKPIKDFEQFRSIVFQKSKSKSYLYRGQSDSEWRLTSSYHRTEKKSNMRFILDNLYNLANYLNSLSDYQFKLLESNGGIEWDRVFTLAQHYGYPTTFVDFTESPYVALYFAAVPKTERKKAITIYELNTEIFSETNSPMISISKGKQNHFYTYKRILERRDPSFTIGNSRAYPQQSVFADIQIANIEDFIRILEEKFGRQYLVKYVLTMHKKRQAEIIRDLRLSGVHYGSLFPGIDGICQSFRERYFDFPG
jgi:hypothetical protein